MLRYVIRGSHGGEDTDVGISGSNHWLFIVRQVPVYLVDFWTLFFV
jgi:hypothetical protein